MIAYGLRKVPVMYKKVPGSTASLSQTGFTDVCYLTLYGCWKSLPMFVLL